jgi:hypothetical protein
VDIGANEITKKMECTDKKKQAAAAQTRRTLWHDMPAGAGVQGYRGKGIHTIQVEGGTAKGPIPSAIKK